MDKTELSYKISQIKKLVNKSDYETAMKIADTIDWRQVRSQSDITMASRVYEKNGEYQDARDILMIAYERSTIGRGILRKLCDLALRSGDVKDAEAYYHEYCDQVDDDDSSQHLLRYLILEAKNAPIEQQINSLEMYCNEELDDKWMYHLAELYEKAGRSDDCVKMCDKIMLMFGIGKYVDRAMELKVKHQPLNSYQMDLVENREKYEQRLRDVQEKYSEADEYAEEPEEAEEAEPAEEAETADEAEKAEPAGEDAEAAAPEEEKAEDKAAETAAPAGEDHAAPEDVKVATPEDLAVQASLHEAKAEEELAREVSRMQTAGDMEVPDEKTRIFRSVRDLKAEDSAAPEKKEEPAAEAAPVDEDDWDIDPAAEEKCGFTLTVSPDAGDYAVRRRIGETLRKMQAAEGVSRRIRGIHSSGLNARGVDAYRDRLNGCDVAVLEAGSLEKKTLADLNAYMRSLREPTACVLVDTQENLDRIAEKWPELMDQYSAYNPETQGASAEKAGHSGKAERSAVDNAEAAAAEAAAKQAAADAAAKRAAAEAAAAETEAAAKQAAADAAAKKAAAKQAQETSAPEKEEQTYSANPSPEGPEMDVEAFVQFACEYAADCDCSIDGKSKLALYDRTEQLRKGGTPLTRETAVNLIEHAADMAEKKKLFTKRYDRNGLLILREKNFFE